MSAPDAPEQRRRWPRRVARILAWVVGLAVAIPVAVLAALLVFLNTGYGQRLVAREAGALSGGAVELAGLSGALPWNIRLGHLALRDAAGTYATADGLHLAWDPLALLGGTARIETLTARAIDFERLPHSAPAKPVPAKPPASGGFSLPVRVVLRRLAVQRLTLGAPVAGVAATLHVAGSADLASLQQGTAWIDVSRLDQAGTYAVAARLTPASINATIHADEPNQGLIASLAHLPNLNGPLHLALALAGPRDAEALKLALDAGPLTVAAGGTVDLPGESARLDLHAHAPAMTPRPGIGWRSVAIDATVAGPWRKPDANGTVELDGLAAGGASVVRLAARVQGNQGSVALDASVDGLQIPGPKPDLLAGATLHLVGNVVLDTPDRPVTFTLTHPLIDATGQVDTGPALHGKVHLSLPQLAPLAAAGGVAVAGSTALDIAFARDAQRTTVSLAGPVSISGGMPQLVALVGDKGSIALDASLAPGRDGQDISLRKLAIDGRAIHLAAHGTDTSNVLDVAYTLGLPDLAAASPALRGALALDGTAKGSTDDLAAHLSASGTFGTATVPTGPIRLTADASGLPAHPEAKISLTGTLDRAPLTLAAEAARSPAGATHIVLRALDWRSLHGTADMTLPAGATLPLGTLDLRMARLADLAPLVHQALTGSLAAHVATASAGGTPRVTVAVRATGAGTSAARVASATLDGTIANPTANPNVALKLAASGIAAGAVAGNATVSVDGPESALAVRADAALRNLAGAPAQIATRATVDVPGKRVTLAALTAAWKGENVRLLAPARITYAPTVSVDRLRLGVQQAVLDIAGRISPTLDLTAHLANVTPALAKPFAPTLDAAGAIDVAAHLTGTTAAPRGTVRLAARGMRLLSGPARAIPAADLLATLGLAGDRTRVDARLTAGRDVSLAVTGTAPLAATGPLDLAARGTIDLAVANPILEAGGRRVAGTLAIDASMRGSAQHPAAAGTIRLAGGDVQDFAQGAHITDISALIAAQGDTVRIERFLGHAGPGTISLSGTVGVLAPSIPVDLALHMNDAQPLASDLLTAELDANLALRGQAATRLDASGTIDVRRATINIPNSFPTSVATLHVIRPGEKPAPPPGKPLLIGLDLRVHAQPAIFVKGHGLFARLGGDLRVGGTSVAPRIGGGFTLANGSFSLAGANLTFTQGRVGFDGGSVTNKLDPTLHFVAQSTSGNVTATLTVGGTASHPKITLSSSPTLPQDEVLAHLLYGVSLSQLSPFQIAAIAQALYSISGGGGGGGPLAGVQNALGLDRLSVGGASNGGSGASLQAGKYVAPGVYVGASQGTSGQSTHAQVQIDLTKRLKLNTTIGTGGGTVTGATPQDDPGSSIGLSYQFQYGR